MKNPERYKKMVATDDELLLCVGCQVMLTSNLSVQDGLVNGSRGVVVGFDNDMPRVRFDSQTLTIDYHDMKVDEDEKITVSQVPLKLAWAITIHKCQGATLDRAEIDLAGIFEYSQAYIALSRVKNLNSLCIKNPDWDCIAAHPDAVQFYNDL